uniref:Uncharacterized protein n=1 Tax=Kalmanozyma brasiliensis (strain GHG001) TaxID=1365824 RepID=V5ET11_KALBG
MSSGSKPAAVGGVDMISVHSDGQESWAELSRYGSDEEGSIRSETRRDRAGGEANPRSNANDEEQIRQEDAAYVR